MPCLRPEPEVLIVIAVVKLNDISARDIFRFSPENKGQSLISVLIGIHDNCFRIAVPYVGFFIFFIQICNVYRSAIYIDPLREKTQTVVTAVEINIHKACLRCISKPQPLCHLESIVLPSLGGIPIIRDQSQFCASVHSQQ